MAQSRGRDAETHGVVGNAQVAVQGDGHAAAQRPTLQHRDRRLAAVRDLHHAGVAHRLVALVRLDGIAHLVELRNVGARHERLVARAAQHDHPDLRIGLQSIDRGGNRFPHRDRHRVVAAGVVEHDPADGTVDLGVHAAGGLSHGESVSEWAG
jgi:hypothetical protein